MRSSVSLFVFASALAVSSSAVASDIDWKQVDSALGKPGSMQPGDVHKYGLPRTDLHVTLDGIEIKPTFALGSWVAFKAMSDGKAMVMGDLVLTEDEVDPVMTKLRAGGVEVTALHNHLLRATPATLYMHIGGEGEPVKLATAIHDALALSKTPLDSLPTSSAAPELGFDGAGLDQILGYKGKANAGVYQFGIPRAENITEDGMSVPPAMGTAIAINFESSGGGKVAATGDFVLLASEVGPVMRTFRENGISVTALHSHMLTEEPRLFFMHFWASDNAEKLAHGLRAALDKINVKGS
ncbi:MAG TPA: DUF1259 domain-containing protein [Candidatus Angelobacter sp.]|nr:DUF1259 domain-containing protein [Candidatus Angelobacter sp.]